jgi:hypothetical protein
MLSHSSWTYAIGYILPDDLKRKVEICPNKNCTILYLSTLLHFYNIHIFIPQFRPQCNLRNKVVALWTKLSINTLCEELHK